MQKSNPPFFTRALLDWYDPTRRSLPWKHIRDPYKIWLSEIILQQTRAEQGRPYYEKFVVAYPTVGDLATAPEDEVMKHWEGLGYYSRARNLHAAAKYIHQELGGNFPTTYPDILALKGVGPYTAAAIASFAYDLPQAVVDGNVYRVLSRFFDDATPIDTTPGKKQFQALATQLLPVDEAAKYNQAIMDLGATICTPKSPLCTDCPLSSECQSLVSDTWSERPVKVKKLKRRERYFNYLVILHPSFRIIQKRTAKDIWRQLYQFPLLESKGLIEDFAELAQAVEWPSWLPREDMTIRRRVGPFKQELTHQRILANFWELELPLDIRPNVPNDFTIVEPENCRNFAFPKIVGCYFDDNSLTLF